MVRGVSVISNAPRLAEMAGQIGFETVWIDVEHGTPGFVEIEHLCLATEAGGAYPTVRIADHSRTNVLRAVEVGARIVVVPMIQTADQATEVVQHAKFPPIGRRGFNTRSRGVGYGLGASPVASFAAANERIHLFAQIETRQAVDNLQSICAVQGLDGIFIGPGDLSVDLGKTGEFTDPELIQLIANTISDARQANIRAGILAPPGPVLEAAIKAGSQLVIAGGDLTNLAPAWQSLLAKL